MKQSKIYTRTGDKGTTSLVGGSRVPKDHSRLEAYGTVDELNSHIGVVISSDECPAREREFLLDIQSRLFDIGSELACPPESPFKLPVSVSPQKTYALEQEIDRLYAELPAVNQFVLPSGTPLAAATHVARTVCRRAERRVLTLSGTAEVNPEIVKYLNRLSDYLFALARYFNHMSDTDEIFWKKDC